VSSHRSANCRLISDWFNKIGTERSGAFLSKPKSLVSVMDIIPPPRGGGGKATPTLKKTEAS
jgi:hypothetical protein